MMFRTIQKMIHMRRFRNGVRRGLAAALSLALVLPMVSTFAANIQLAQIQVKQATADEFPDIEIEGNFVRDEFGFLTGYYELGLRVKTPVSGSFRGLSVALQYDASILTPVDWSEVGAPITVAGMNYYEVQLPTQKLASISTATAHAGGVIAPGDSLGTPPQAGEKGLLSFTVNSYDPVKFPGDLTKNPEEREATTLAVVRFRIRSEVLDHIKITKTSTGDYEVKCGNTVVTNIAQLRTAFNTTIPGVGTGENMVDFATDDDIADAGEVSKNADAQMALDYTGDYEFINEDQYKNEYYHIPEYSLANTDSYDTNVPATIGDKSYTFNEVPKTRNNKVLAVDPDKYASATGTAWDNYTFSYITNLIVNTDSHTYISFPIVSKRSFVDQSDTLGNLTTIVYVDWDNTLLGTQVVPKNSDIRQLVSDHVAENFIYHDADNTTYGPNDLNNPLEAADPTAMVSSLKRKDTYRGKYTANGPAAESVTDGTVVTDGGSYPLTNKLDYVFLKRPMTHTVAFDETANPKPDVDDSAQYPQGAADPGYIADMAAYEAAYDAWYWSKTEWSQQVDEVTGEPVWDTERPYAYGWAECTIDNFEEVWTTLGMGELGSTTAVTEAGAVGTTMGYSGANSGGYQAIPSTSVASVTFDGDAAFAFADLSKGFNKNMVFLKAVYEPGEGLQNRSVYYRMLEKPYYNKFNNNSADDGGAYLISVTYERAAENPSGALTGVARIREPVVRQDTTTDLKWEESTTPLVNHNLSNAEWDETYARKNKTTFTRLEVPNSEEIVLEMSYSARQNKIDFYLMEMYGQNFVVAGMKTAANSSRDFDKGEYTADNYNYYVNDTTKVPATYYAPSAYADREGTYGFVLFGTLNYLMEQATAYANGTVEYGVFFTTISNSLTDANLKKSDGNNFAISDVTGLVNTFEAAANAAKTLGTADYWNADRECAELSYHQLQIYLNGGGLLSRTAADGQTIRWCHLHTACAALMSGKPLTWKDLIQAAVDGNNTNIEKLTIPEIESNFHLRTDGAGSTGWTSTSFANRVIDAVDKLTTLGVAQNDITWDMVQYILDHGDVASGDATTSANEMNKYGAENYWWYDGKTVTTFADVVLAADAASATPSVPQTLPDGRDVKSRTAKLNQIKSAFPTNPNEPSEDWIKFTENLTMGQKGTSDEEKSQVKGFTDFDDFIDQIVSAVEEVGVEASWHEIQHAILGTCSDPSDSEHDGYWWHNGGVNITDLASLLKAAQKDDVWANVDFNIFNGLGLDLRAELKGTAIDASNFATVKSKIAAYAKTTGANLTNDAWDAVQYYIIHQAVNTNRTNAEKPYYWWKNGGSKDTSLNFTPSGSVTDGTLADSMAKLLSDAYFRITFNGYSDSDYWAALTEADLTLGRLVKSQTGSESSFSALGQLATGDISALDIIGKVKTLFEAANGGAGNYTPYPSPIPTLPYTPIDWTALQAAIMNDSTSNPDYWWKKADSKAGDPADDLAALSDAILAYVDSGSPADLAALQALFTLELATNLELVDYNGNPLTQDIVDELNNNWEAAIQSGETDADAFDNPPLTWHQIEFFVISNDDWGEYCFFNHNNALDELDFAGIGDADWLSEGYSLTRAPRRLSPQQLSEQQARSLKTNTANSLSVLEGDEAFLAQMMEDEDFMDTFGALAALLGFGPKDKTGEKAPEGNKGGNTYTLNSDTTIYPAEDPAQKKDEPQTEPETGKDQGITAPSESEEVENKAEEKPAEEKNPVEEEKQSAGEENSDREENVTARNAATGVDNNREEPEIVEEEQPENILTTRITIRALETGQRDGPIIGTSPTGVDPPPWWRQRRLISVLTTVADIQTEEVETYA